MCSSDLSNDSSHLLGEARLGLLLQRLAFGAGAMGAREMLEIATRGGAGVLGRSDIGALAPGLAADVVGFPLNGVAMAGAQQDPLAALLFCQPPSVGFSVIHGQVRVRDGRPTGIDVAHLVDTHNRLARALVT